MTRISIRSILVLLTASGLALAQTAPVTPTAPPMQTASPADAYGQPQRTAGAPAAARPAYGLPQQVTMKAGTFVTVRINEMLASNKNQAGDSFSGTLAQPVIVGGVVVAQRGQAIYGRVSLAEKVKGVSHLGVELTGLTLADGEQVSVHSQLISRQGGMIPPGQAGSIATGGVLATHSHPSILYPGTATTFQIQSALAIATGNAPQAFRFAGPEDYNGPSTQVAQRSAVVQRPGYNGSYPYGYSPYYYPYYPYYWGPSMYVGGFWGGGFRFGGGFRRFR
ncbi:MAG: hypothetical protein ABSF62_02925 [Bryobacteraceae bacterium]|jgi:hypothetical protein